VAERRCGNDQSATVSVAVRMAEQEMLTAFAMFWRPGSVMKDWSGRSSAPDDGPIATYSEESLERADGDHTVLTSLEDHLTPSVLRSTADLSCGQAGVAPWWPKRRFCHAHSCVTLPQIVVRMSLKKALTSARTSGGACSHSPCRPAPARLRASSCSGHETTGGYRRDIN
jgi:hypothetical protein